MKRAGSAGHLPGTIVQEIRSKEAFTITEITFREITDPEQKSTLCNDILRALPHWFGVEASLVGYVQAVRELPVCAAFEGAHPVGFVGLKLHSPDTVEISVMGVLTHLHRRGVGRRLVEWCVDRCRAGGRTFLTVKTLDDSRPDEGYERTRHFYCGMGFKKLETFPLHWDEYNPCLFMARYIPPAGGAEGGGAS